MFGLSWFRSFVVLFGCLAIAGHTYAKPPLAIRDALLHAFEASMLAKWCDDFEEIDGWEEHLISAYYTQTTLIEGETFWTGDERRLIITVLSTSLGYGEYVNCDKLAWLYEVKPSVQLVLRKVD